MTSSDKSIEQLKQAIADVERNGKAAEGTARADVLKKLKRQLAEKQSAK